MRRIPRKAPPKKKRGKKPEKKVPAVKLIEGKYQYKVIIRLKPGDQAEALDKLMKFTNNKVQSFAFMEAMYKYQRRCEELDRLKEKVQDMELSSMDNDRLLQDLKKNLCVLMDIEPIKWTSREAPDEES